MKRFAVKGEPREEAHVVSKASFAWAQEVPKVTGMMVGAVTPFSLPPDLPLYVDARIMSLDWVILSGGGRNSKVRISSEVFTRLGTEMAEGLAMERASEKS